MCILRVNFRQAETGLGGLRASFLESFQILLALCWANGKVKGPMSVCQLLVLFLGWKESGSGGPP